MINNDNVVKNPNQPKLAGLSNYSMSLVVIILGILSMTLIFWTNKVNKEQFQISLRADVLSDLRGELGHFNRAVYQYLDNSDPKPLKHAASNIMMIRIYIESLAHGGLAHHGIILEAIDDDELLPHLPSVSKAIDDFENVAQKLFTENGSENKMTKNQLEINGVFFGLMKEVDSFTSISEKNIGPSIARINRLYRWVLGLWVLFVLLSGYFFIRLDLSRRHAHMALADSEEKYHKLFDNANDAVFLWEIMKGKEHGKLLEINQKARNILGHNKNEQGTFPPDTFCFEESIPNFSRIIKILQTEKQVTYELTHKTPSGPEIPFEISSILFKWRKKEVVLSIARNISRRKQLNAEIIKNKNLELMGILAGGVAHDFNNLLAIIAGYVSLLKGETQADSPHYEKLTVINEASCKAAEITKKLLLFASGGETKFQKVNLSQLLVETIPCLVNTEQIECTYDIAEDLWLNRADPGEVRQVIENLVINAQDSMPDGGTINIVAKAVSLKESSSFQLTSGMYVELIIIDDGSGIASNDLDKIFAPYFSTHERSVKKGMGLGLAICHAIVNRHKGHLSVESSAEKGTTAMVYFPLLNSSK